MFALLGGLIAGGFAGFGIGCSVGSRKYRAQLKEAEEVIKSLKTQNEKNNSIIFEKNMQISELRASIETLKNDSEKNKKKLKNLII